MAQGAGKLGTGRKDKSKGSQKRQVVRAKTLLQKGRKEYKPKGAKAACLHEKYEKDTTKTINRRLESEIAAKAVGVGTKFFLTDIADKGEKEGMRQVKERDRKQLKSSKRSKNDLLKEQIDKLRSKK